MTTARYVAPFAAYVAFLAVGAWTPVSADTLVVIRFVIVAALILLVSRPVIPWRPSYALLSLVLGVVVFAIWVGPDFLWPGYRSHWLFTNSITGAAKSSLAPTLKQNVGFIVLRVASSIVLVPILEELFWRGWLMRYLIDKRFLKVPIGTYDRLAFWLVAALFASEHGPYWEVGLLAGIAYNWLILRTRNLADCILAHAVTNACLAVYVLYADQWQYWL